MNIFSLLSSAFNFKFPSISFSKNIANRIGSLTGRTGISLHQVKPSYILNFGKHIVHSLKSIQSFYKTQMKNLFESDKPNPFRYAAAVGVALQESASYIGFQLCSVLFSSKKEADSTASSCDVPAYKHVEGREHHHPMKVYTVFSMAVNRASDEALHLKESGMVSQLETAGSTLSAMKVADELESIIAQRRQDMPIPSAPPCPDEQAYMMSSFSPVMYPQPSAPPCPDEMEYAASLNMSTVSSSAVHQPVVLTIDAECPISYDSFNWDTFVFTKFDLTPDKKVCRVFSKEALETWVDSHGTHPILRDQHITINDFQSVKDHKDLIMASFTTSAMPISENLPSFEPVYYKQSAQVSSFFDHVALDLSQDKLTTLSRQINDLLNVITDDFVPGTQRLTALSDSISDSYHAILKRQIPEGMEGTFGAVFHTVLQKELLTVEMMNSFRVESVLNKKIAEAYALPSHVTDMYDKLLELREEAEFIVAQFNSIQTFLEESQIYSQIELLRSDLEMLKIEANGPKTERFSTILNTVDMVSQNLMKVTSFMNDFEAQDLDHIKAYFEKPSDVAKDMLLNLFAVMSVHESGELDQYRA